MQNLLFSVGFGEKEQSKISDYLNKILETAEMSLDKWFTYISNWF